MRQVALLAVVCSLLGLAAPLVAREFRPDGGGEPTSRLEVEVIGDERGTLPLFWPDRGSRWSEGYWQGTVEARAGERYRLRIRNRTGGRIGLVIAVDGRNIISGDRSCLRSSESMYVLNPGQTAVFHGWRSGLSRENRFYFTTAEDSYAGAWGDTSRLGTIEVAAFQERARFRRLTPLPSPPWYDEARGKVAPAAPQRSRAEGLACERDSRPGTGYGEEVYSRVQEIEFDAEPFPFERQLIRYEWPSGRRRYEPAPRYLPEDDRSGFAPPPHGR
jgi:hypothetical protein